MIKEKQWKGYYNYYLAEGKRRGVHPLQVVDDQWSDSRKRAEGSVLPYISSESVVLEIGCGIGRFGRYVAPACKHLYCTDILDEALAELKIHLREHNNISIQKTNGYDLSPFAADFFDCVYSFTTFFHLDFEIVVQYFSEIKRVLKPGGVAILEFKQWVKEQDVISLLAKIKRQGGIEKYETQVDKWRYVSKEMLKVLCDYYELKILHDDVTKYTFRK